MRRSAPSIVLIAAAASLVLPASSTSAIAASAQATSPSASDLIPRLYKNCTNYNQRYSHGVGRRLARDKTSGEPVTNFRRSTLLYRRAIGYNRGLDRDKDGIACEKR